MKRIFKLTYPFRLAVVILVCIELLCTIVSIGVYYGDKEVKSFWDPFLALNIMLVGIAGSIGLLVYIVIRLLEWADKGKHV